MDNPSEFYAQGRSLKFSSRGAAPRARLWSPWAGTQVGHELPEPWAGDRGQRSQLYGSAGSGAPCFPWLQTLFRVMAKIIKLLKKWNSFSFTPVFKKKKKNNPAGLICKPQQGEGAEAVENGLKLQQVRVIVSKRWNLRSYKEADEWPWVWQCWAVSCSYGDGFCKVEAEAFMWK